MNREPIEFSIQQLIKLETLEILFDMKEWGTNISTHPPHVPEDNTCEFAGCYMGWAAHQQWFDQFGVPLRIRKIDPRASGSLTLAGDIAGQISHNAAINAVCGMMDIEESTLDWIILPDQYPTSGNITPGMVAARLRRLLVLGENEFVTECENELAMFNNEEDAHEYDEHIM